MKPQASCGNGSTTESCKSEPKCDLLRKKGLDQGAHNLPADAVLTLADRDLWTLQVRLDAWRHVMRYGQFPI